MNPELNLFLASIEKRAFRMARLATRQDDDALELVQEAMLRLVQQYGGRHSDEWKPLFYRILENCLTDWHRQQQRQRRWMFWRQPLPTDPHQDEADGDMETDHDDGDDLFSRFRSPEQALARERQQHAVLALLEQLPLQQQQCFLLRCWEGLSVQETATALGISDGSVKTHLHRVRQKLERLCADHQYDQEAQHETG
ncbi:RNA polymerase sigma factor [Parathalassolituus penaei]|uniref:RNA polymerase sigma factor n=1 Tax=Parathalassolituus penaei TaxID=2997323 RepID=A0A9X3IV57_9GAMM|nr:RNA polymerase sigma factor [Parathalassolituus penaei]MCY0966908.1 RNA polymerase sigma factor [Parathalassolituus penaei]